MILKLTAEEENEEAKTVDHEFFQVHLNMLALRLNEGQEGEVALLRILEDVEFLMASTKHATIKQNRSRVLEHMNTFPGDDVRVTFLLQVTMGLSFFFLIGSKKLHGSPLCMCPMESA